MPPHFIMEMTLYKTVSARERLEKTLTDPLKINGVLRLDTDILQPYLTLEKDATQYNYAYIPQFNRYYFITTCRVIRTGLFGVSLSIDVLMSYKDAIKKISGNLISAENGNPYSSDADFNTDVRRDTTQYRYDYTFKRQDKMILIGLVGA